MMPPMMTQQVPVQYGAPGAAPVMMAAPQMVTAPAVAQAPVVQAGAPIQAAPVGGTRVYTPQGAEMLQVTVFGTKQLPGAEKPAVEISIDGKPHKHNLDTLAITGPQLTPKTLITYYLPGENLNFIVSEGGNVLGDVQISGQDFHPNGLEGDLPLMDPQSGNQGPGYLMVKIVPLGVNGKMEELAPVHIQAESKPLPADPPAYVASTSNPRAISPDEWQRLGEQGATMVVQEGGPVAAPAPVVQPQPQPVVIQQQPVAGIPQQPQARQFVQQQQPQQVQFAAPGAMPTQVMPGFAPAPGQQVFMAPQVAPQQTYIR